MSKEHSELEFWQEARKHVNITYKVTKSFPNVEPFGSANQMRISAVSIPSNITEGFGRQIARDTINFLHISQVSLHEFKKQCFVALDQQNLTNKQFENINNNIKS